MGAPDELRQKMGKKLGCPTPDKLRQKMGKKLGCPTLDKLRNIRPPTGKKPKGKPQRPPKRTPLQKRISKMFLRRKLKQTLVCSPKRRKLTTNFWPPTGKKPKGKPQRPIKWTQLRQRIPK